MSRRYGERGRRARTKEAGITARITGGYERGIVGERACVRAGVLADKRA